MSSFFRTNGEAGTLDLTLKASVNTAMLTPRVPNNLYVYLSGIIQKWLSTPNCFVVNVVDLYWGAGVVITISYPPKLRDTILASVRKANNTKQLLRLPGAKEEEVECTVVARSDTIELPQGLKPMMTLEEAKKREAEMVASGEVKLLRDILTEEEFEAFMDFM